ncbi:MAG: VOC family protein [Sandaracinaceae bacterium]
MSTHHPGRVVWHELVTQDVERAKGFYGEVFGWRITDEDMGGHPYHFLFGPEESPLGAMVQAQPQVPDHWLSYVSVADVDLAAERAEALGGTVVAPPTDIPVGRFTVIVDPQGATIAAFRAREGDPAEVERPGPKTFCWDHLNTTDVDGALGFHREVFGWSAEPFGEDPSSRVLSAGGRQRASLSAAPAGSPAAWLTHVVVDDLERANATATRLGGSVMMPGQDVPGIGRFSVIVDPAGAPIAPFVPAAT